jgi:hypothetical protein
VMGRNTERVKRLTSDLIARGSENTYYVYMWLGGDRKLLITAHSFAI